MIDLLAQFLWIRRHQVARAEDVRSKALSDLREAIRRRDTRGIHINGRAAIRATADALKVETKR